MNFFVQVVFGGLAFGVCLAWFTIIIVGFVDKNMSKELNYKAAKLMVPCLILGWVAAYVLYVTK